jgi:hypothetical protein
MEEKKYIVSAYDKKFYCKVSTIPQYNKPPVHTLSFGGRDTYCIIIAIHNDSGYIDRIEYDDKCVKDGTLEETGGSIKLVKACLWTIRVLFPSSTKLTLKDDSHIYCKKGSKQYKLSLSYDYILKYNQTWYEKQFGAVLPQNYTIDYKQSLKVLDLELAPFEWMSIRGEFLLPYKEIYVSSSTPREFIQNLRNVYGVQYCFEVGGWLSKYIELLGITIFKEMWIIPSEHILEVPNYSINATSDSIRGGKRSMTRKSRNFRIVSRGDESCSIVGHTDCV